MNLFEYLEFKTLFCLNLALSILFYFINKRTISPKINNRVIKLALLYIGTPVIASIPLAIANLSLYYNKNSSVAFNISESLGSSLGTILIPYVLFLVVYGIVSFIKKTYK